jgi:hypothetical protein
MGASKKQDFRLESLEAPLDIDDCCYLDDRQGLLHDQPGEKHEHDFPVFHNQALQSS